MERNSSKDRRSLRADRCLVSSRKVEKALRDETKLGLRRGQQEAWYLCNLFSPTMPMFYTEGGK